LFVTYMGGSLMADKYENLTAAGTGLKGYGTALKALGFAVGVGGVVVLFILSERSFGMGVVAFAGGGVAGIMLHWAGTLVAAFGEAMFALRDIARNTEKR
jgi:hypothetical protein